MHEGHKALRLRIFVLFVSSLCPLWLTKLRQTKNDIFMPFTVQEEIGEEVGRSPPYLLLPPDS